MRFDDTLPRRGILSGLAALGGAATVGLAVPPQAASSTNSLPVRQDIARFVRAPHRLALLEATIGEMQRRSRIDPDDPKGWRVHASAHTQVCSAVSNADNAQVAVRRLGSPDVEVSVVPLSLGPAQRDWPRFVHTRMGIVEAQSVCRRAEKRSAFRRTSPTIRAPEWRNALRFSAIRKIQRRTIQAWKLPCTP